MDIFASLAVITLAGLVHASFQLSVSVLTLLSGHAIGAQHSRRRVLSLTSSFVFGTVVITTLLLATIALVFNTLFGSQPPHVLWIVISGVMIAIGIAVWAFYYRRDRGTSLWVPRGFATFLAQRAKATKTNPEAFSLGVTSVLSELLFVIAPLLVSAAVLVTLPPLLQLVGIVLYVVVSLITLGSVWVLVGGGRSLSEIKRWREANKYFLQFAAGAALIILAVFVYTFAVIGKASL